MLTKGIFLLIIYASILSTGFTQESIKNEIDLFDNLNQIGNTAISAENMAPGFAYDNRYEGIKGSPYWFEDWSLGKVDFIGFKSYENVLIKYDVVNQKVVLKLGPDSIEYVVEPEIIERFYSTYLGTENRFVKFDKFLFEKPKDKTTFYRVVHDGEIPVIHEVTKYLKKADFQGAYAAGEAYDEFVKREAYYILLPNGKFKEIILKENSVVKGLPASKAKLFKAYFEENDIKLKTEQTLRLALDYVENH